MSVLRRHFAFRIALPVLLLLAFAVIGCGNPKIVIQSPANNSSVVCSGTPPLCSVSVVTQWTGAIVSAPALTLDNVLVANALNINGTGTVTAPLGQHTIMVNGTIVINSGTSNVSDTSTFTVTLPNPPPPTLLLSPAGGISLQAGTTGSVKVTTSTPLSATLSVTVSSANPNFAKVGTPPSGSTTVTLPASTSTPSSVLVPVTAVAAGQTTLSASASGLSSTPKINITVTTAAPPPPKAVVFRSSGTDVQSFVFSGSNTWMAIDTQPATFSPGSFVVGLAFTASGPLLRTSASDIQVFTINSNSTLTANSSIGAFLSGTGAAVASTGSNVIRAANTGIQSFTLAGTTLSSAGSKLAGSATTGTGVDTVGGVAVRVYGNGIEVFNVAAISSPQLSGSNLTNAQSSTAPAAKIFASGTRAIRAHDSGVEVYDITSASVPLLGSASGGASSSGAAVALNGTATLAVRAYSGGIEVYSLSTSSQPTKVAAFTNGALASTGVGVCVKGTIAFRTTDAVIEAYDITSAATGTITPLGQPTPATPSSTGVALVCR